MISAASSSADPPVNGPAPHQPPASGLPKGGLQRPRLTLSRHQRLKGKTSIDAAYNNGQRRHHQPIMACLLRRGDNAPSRLGISIGRKCGNAVMRNAIRRRIREGYRQAQYEFPPGLDILLVIRPHKILTVMEYQRRLRTLLL